jgi:hypothetical protein
MITEPTSPLLRWLAVSVVLATGWLYYNRSVAPLRHSHRTALGAIAELNENIRNSAEAIEEIKAFKERVAQAHAEVDELVRDIPTASALFWFPARMSRHFTRFGIPQAATRHNSTLEEPTFRNYERTFWAVELPMTEEKDLSKVLLAVAELESQDVLVRVLDFAVRPSSEDPSKPVAIINVTALARR